MTGPGEGDDGPEAAGNEPKPSVGDDAGQDRAPAPEPGAETDDRAPGWRLFLQDVLSSVFAVLLVGAYLFAVSGVWPPLVAVESRSMVPNMQINDLVFVMEEQRFAGQEAINGVVTARQATENDYRQFGRPGDVVVYEPGGDGGRTPIIHRAMFWVQADENWYAKADRGFVRGADSCAELRNCPAPHAGFITKGDNNGNYDQATGLSGPVRSEWVVGTAEVRVPGLGWVRLRSTGAGSPEDRDGAGGPVPAP